MDCSSRGFSDSPHEFSAPGLGDAVGESALYSNTTGLVNTAVGAGALANNTIGNGNIVLGIVAGQFVSTANNVICIGAGGADVNNTTWIGNIYGVTTQSGTSAPVLVSNTGQLGTVVSSERFKKDIAAMDKTVKLFCH